MHHRPLWAPWRIEYVQAPREDRCVFCEALAGREGAEAIVERGDGCFTILNAFPYASGHVMVAPNRHVGELERLSEGELLSMMRLVRHALAALRKAMAPDGFNVGLNLGRVSGAGIADHLHMHVVPRWEGDNNFMPVLGDIRVLPQALEASRDALTRALRDLAQQ